MRKLVLVACVLLGCDSSEPPQTPSIPPAPAPSAAPEAAPETPTVSETPTTPEPDAAAAAATPPPHAAPATCLAEYTFDGDSSVLDEQRRRGGAARWDDFATRYEAAYLDPDSEHPVEVVSSFRIGDTPLLWFRADFSAAVVNAAVLESLTVVDATGLRPGQRQRIGALTELGRGKIGGRELAHFLLRADVVQTYVHIGSSVCLAQEQLEPAGPGSYRARFTGEHVYFTNEENHDSFEFWLELATDGELSISRPAQDDGKR